MIVIDYTDRRPLYEQVIERFRDLILKGILERDMPMPSVRSLAVELSINPNTIQRAYAELERTGWIYSVRGKGSFVAQPEEKRTERREEILHRLSALAEEAARSGLRREDFERVLDLAKWTSSDDAAGWPDTEIGIGEYESGKEEAK